MVPVELKCPNIVKRYAYGMVGQWSLLRVCKCVESPTGLVNALTSNESYG